MANWFKRAASAVGRFTGLSPAPAPQERHQDFALIEPVAAEIGQAPEVATTDLSADIDAALNADAAAGVGADLMAIETSAVADAVDAFDDAVLVAADTTTTDTLWGDALNPPTETPALFAETVIATGTIADDAPVVTLAAVQANIDEAEPVVAILTDPAACGFAAPEIPLIADDADDAKAPIEFKPQPAAAAAASAASNPNFAELFDLVSAESAKRVDSAMAVYERLLTATRAELDAARTNNRIAWSVGGVMTAVAAMGAVWSAGEVSASRVELGSLKQQVVQGERASVERDQLRTDLAKTREASAKVEIDALKSRLDQALAVSTERDRLRGELEMTRRARTEAEGELRVARAAAATTQPIGYAQPASAAQKLFADRPAATKATDSTVGSERPDVWSVLLNGKE